MSLKSDYQIVHLTAEDVGLMRSLLDLFGEVFQEKETYCSNQPSDYYLQSLLGKDDFIALLALQANEVVGGLVAYELHKFEQQRSEIYIYDLAVDESFRRRGIATNLIGSLQKIAKKRGAYVVFVQADYGDEPAIQLYETLGQREDVLHFDIAPSSGEKQA